jgi:hypothetical protein
MKRIIHILFYTLLILSFQLTFSQKVETTSTGPIPKLRLEKSHTQVNPGQNTLLETARGHSSIQNFTLSIPIPDGTPFTLLSSWTPPNFASSMTAEPSFWPIYYYITEIGPPAALYKMDAETGIVTLLGDITGMNADQPNGISYCRNNDKYYIVSSTNLYSFDLETLTTTYIGSFNAGGLMIDLCFDWAGVCYAYDLADDNAYTINISTGNATLLGPLGYDAHYGQGMSYDFETSTIYLSAFNVTTMTGQLRTMDPVTGMTTLITDWGYEQIAPFALPTWLCMSPVGQPSNPSPPNGTTGVPLNGNTLTWTNGVYTINVEIWFGVRENVVKVYDGPAITSWELDTLLYSTQYRWKIICKDTTCGGSYGPTWIFTTENFPGTIFMEPFHDLSCWTWIGPLGQANWSSSTTGNAGGSSPELRCTWTPSYVGLNQMLSCVINSTAGHNHEFRFKYMYDWYADPAPAHGLAITYDGGITSTSLWEQTPFGGNTGPEEIVLQYTPTSSSFQLIFYNNGDSFNMDDTFYDEVVVTDLEIVPVELSSFTSQVDYNTVTLFWQTATETNNSGFEIQRILYSKIEQLQNWETIGFVEGKGTTTEIQSYSFQDEPGPGKFKYRLKQIDFDGSFAYSPEIEVEVKAPMVFSLEQNYPNPFNPTTKISWQSPVSSWQTLKVYDVLGNEVAVLVNEYRYAGSYEVEFSVTSGPESSIKNLASGIYFYRLNAGDYVETKKMTLMK